MEDQDENLHPRTYYTEVKGTGILSVIIFGIITFVLMAIISKMM